MAIPVNTGATVKPGSAGVIKPPVNKEAVKRKALIDAARRKQTAALTKENTKSLNAVRRKKGVQNYSSKYIQGDTDFGVGKAGPGVPYSIQSEKVAENKVGQSRPKPKPLPNPTKAKGLWATTGNVSKTQKNDWKLRAIRRRLGNA